MHIENLKNELANSFALESCFYVHFLLHFCLLFSSFIDRIDERWQKTICKLITDTCQTYKNTITEWIFFKVDIVTFCLFPFCIDRIKEWWQEMNLIKRIEWDRKLTWVWLKFVSLVLAPLQIGSLLRQKEVTIWGHARSCQPYSSVDLIPPVFVCLLICHTL